jgi:formate dehydrogenase gamma subunit
MSTITSVSIEKHYPRFSLTQRLEHVLLILSFSILLLTGLPQKYRLTSWSQYILSTPQRMETIQTIHHIAAALLCLEILYHLGHAFYLMSKKKLSGAMLPTWQDVKDAWQMIKYLVFLSKHKPLFGKYNFEQKFTYWFIFFVIGVMTISGFILWFPETLTKILPGGIIPAAKLAHSTEAVVAGAFIIIWHFYHVHVERLNLSIFTGNLTEEDMQSYHPLELNRSTIERPDESDLGGKA